MAEASLTPEDLEAAKEQAEKALRRPTRAELIHEVDPSWQEGDSVSHLQAMTGPDDYIVRYIRTESAPGTAG